MYPYTQKTQTTPQQHTTLYEILSSQFWTIRRLIKDRLSRTYVYKIIMTIIIIIIFYPVMIIHNVYIRICKLILQFCMWSNGDRTCWCVVTDDLKICNISTEIFIFIYFNLIFREYWIDKNAWKENNNSKIQQDNNNKNKIINNYSIQQLNYNNK